MQQIISLLIICSIFYEITTEAPVGEVLEIQRLTFFWPVREMSR